VGSHLRALACFSLLPPLSPSPVFMLPPLSFLLKVLGCHGLGIVFMASSSSALAASAEFGFLPLRLGRLSRRLHLPLAALLTQAVLSALLAGRPARGGHACAAPGRVSDKQSLIFFIAK